MAQPVLDSPQPIQDLNTTPLIDVLLVLLVMFIITIPMQTHQVGIDLPTAPSPVSVQPDPIRNRITIDSRDVIRWNGAAVSQQSLRALLRQSMTLSVEPALDLTPASDARYLLVDSVLADIKRAGVSKLGLPGNEAYRAF